MERPVDVNNINMKWIEKNEYKCFMKYLKVNLTWEQDFGYLWVDMIIFHRWEGYQLKGHFYYMIDPISTYTHFNDLQGF